MSLDATALRSELEQLETKAAQLRRRLLVGVSSEIGSGQVRLLACRVGQERVALVLDDVQEVVSMPALARIPEAPPWVAGMLNLRGAMVVVIDAWARIHDAERAPRLDDRIVISEVEGRTFGFAVQEVYDVEITDASAVAEPATGVPHAPYLLGVLPGQGGTLMLLSQHRLIAGAEPPREED